MSRHKFSPKGRIINYCCANIVSARVKWIFSGIKGRKWQIYVYVNHKRAGYRELAHGQNKIARQSAIKFHTSKIPLNREI
ncbi:hypothetical protein EII21_04865 [Conchiformibius steedae]|uniref:Uncharacterized protein n=1 Tax=Conchiformibius steedae TaxID=153493 RepID=A0A3P2A5G0_9NEIS|nr:hypothetical protein EII21_04865 [Conchiformibius steedae]